MLEWAHKTDGHPGVERTLWFFEKYFFAKSSDASLRKILSKIIAECPCTKAKANTAADRGAVRNLPIPNQMNSILYVDFMELPKFAGHDFALLVPGELEARLRFILKFISSVIYCRFQWIFKNRYLHLLCKASLRIPTPCPCFIYHFEHNLSGTCGICIFSSKLITYCAVVRVV